MPGNTKDRFISGRKSDVQSIQSVRNSLFYTGLAYLTFVIYGSLVPLDFHNRSWDNAWQAFMAIPYLNLGIGSRADWVANILLFIPLAFIWLGILWHRSNFGLRVLSTLTILFCAFALSIGIEFTQLFFPPRTVSLNDIIAESIGACIGIFLWWIYGEKLLSWLTRWSLAKGNTGLAERLLFLYLFGLFGYNLLPLDLTLSPIEIYHKWKEGRVILIPFSYIFENPQQALYGVISDVAIWAPVAFLWQLASTRPAFSIWLYVISASALLEFLQLFVYTRVSNVTQILTAALGAVIGLQLVNLFKNEKLGAATAHSRKSNGALHLILWLAATLFWTAIIITVFWYPFDFHFSREFAAKNLPGMLRVPFLTYYYGTEYRAITEVLHKMGFFLPLGALLGLGVTQIHHYSWRQFAGWFAILSISLFALGIELGQAFLPGKFADITDWMLETLGGILGYSLFKIILSRSGHGYPTHRKHQRNAQPTRFQE
ncbi:VanZ family protein [Sulfurirhabdus autotrophica]|uniref:VanZ like protein n=1 Tax=Sulfurirhabdus autotrophica TaxID=1706046 RepID=A0A4R3YCI7_9PROT|nr:VanZ family protein [Sulfurirhabdus autotrophica]TCV88113.1 VanZ like protein [Sulfurirhabdus autotrophica]